MKKAHLLMVCCLIMISHGLWSPVTEACQLPVYRYALERWEPSPYTLIIFGEGERSTQAQTLIKKIEDYAYDESKPINIEVFYQDTRLIEEDWIKAVHATLKPGEDSVMILPDIQGYPHPQDIVWHGKASIEALEPLLFSPMRAEIARQLAAGKTAVVIWLPAEGAEDAQLQGEELASVMKKIGQQAKLVDLPEEDINLYIKDRPPLMAEFPVLTIDRHDPKEQGTLALLSSLSSEEAFQASHAYVIFGRGRILTALTQDQLNLEVCTEVSSFLLGECSCKVKADNPGFDFLMAADWKDHQHAGHLDDLPLPSLAGVQPDPEVISPSKEASSVSAFIPDPQQNQTVSMLFYVVISVLGVLFAMGTVAVVLIRRNAQS